MCKNSSSGIEGKSNPMHAARCLCILSLFDDSAAGDECRFGYYVVVVDLDSSLYYRVLNFGISHASCGCK